MNRATHITKRRPFIKNERGTQMKMSDVPMITYFWGKPLSECSNGEIVNALRWSRPGIVEPAAFGDVLSEAVKREILPAASWLVQV
jgi:hypothetical protein